MNPLEYKPFYQRNLPHYQSPGATLFITFRLAGSIPKSAQQQLRAESERIDARLAHITDPQERVKRAYLEQRRFFGKWDAILDTAKHGPLWLHNSQVAECVAECLHYPDSQMYDLDTFCIMPNHVHVVFTPLPQDDETYYSMSSIMHSVKGNSAHQANHHLGRSGQFWQHENYDHVVRNPAEWKRIIKYVINNPVKAGLIQHAEDWPWTYCKHW